MGFKRFFPGWSKDENQRQSDAEMEPFDEGSATGIGDAPWPTSRRPHEPVAEQEHASETAEETPEGQAEAAIDQEMDEDADDAAQTPEQESQANVDPWPTPPAQPARLLSGYRSSDEHLWDELCRIEELVRAQTIRWRRTIGGAKPDHLWGMVHVTDDEVDSYLHSWCMLPADLPEEIKQDMQPYWEASEQKAREIALRRMLTDPDVRAHLRLDQLTELFDLSDMERDILLVCLLPELDGRYRRLYGYLQDDASRTRPTVELALQILYPVAPSIQAGRDAFDARAPLLRQHLLAIGLATQTDEPLPMRSIRIDDRIAGYLLSSAMQDGRLEDIVSPADDPFAAWEQLIATSEHIYRLQALAHWWHRLHEDPEGGLTLFLHGPYGSGRRKAAQAICAVTGTPLLVADLPAAVRSPHGYELIVDLCYREARLRGAALLWTNCETLLDAEQATHRWDYLVTAAEQFPGLTFLSSERAWEPAGRFRQRPFARVNFAAPGYELRWRLWEQYLPPSSELASAPGDRAMLISQLANGFQFTEGQIADALTTARELAAQRGPRQPLLTLDDLFEGCRRQSSRHLSTFAQRIAPGTRLTFDQLILPATNKRQLQELRNRIRDRGQVYTELGFERRLSLGKGVIALFTGSSGTGKTMAAELIADERQVDLFKVDLSAVVSKYIGETEKNLNRVFAEAEGSNAIIFFDEADALFGKRGKVEEARDRWANIEVNYLLQRLEEYAGVVILATNLRQNMDEAFLRRIHVIVDFPFPDAQARKQIWFGMFPAGVTPPPDQHIAAVAQQFPLAGGSIRNVVLDATFRALAGNSVDQRGTIHVTQRQTVLGIAREYQKQGKPLTQGEFGAQFYEWVEEDILLTPAPGERSRLRIWHEAFPPDVVSPPKNQVQELAQRFELRPFAIRGSVDDAVQQAGDENSRDALGRIEVEQRHLVQAIARAYQRQGKPITREEFGGRFYDWATHYSVAAPSLEQRS